MAISQKLLDRGNAVGLSPKEDESSQSFGSRVRKAEAANSQPVASGFGRRAGR